MPPHRVNSSGLGHGESVFALGGFWYADPGHHRDTDYAGGSARPGAPALSDGWLECLSCSPAPSRGRGVSSLMSGKMGRKPKPRVVAPKENTLPSSDATLQRYRLDVCS